VRSSGLRAKMASAMHQTIQTCQNMATMAQTQMMDEDKIDPFPARTTVELDEMVEACLRTKEVLGREELIYSKNADFTRYSDQELVAMNAFVRESSRMLSIILAGGAQHFWNGQGLSTSQELKNMYHYIDDKVKEFYLLDKIIEFLDIKTKYGRKGVVPTKTASLSTHPEALAFIAIDANRAPTSQETLLRVAQLCEKFAVQCRAVSQTRALKMDDRTRKTDVKERLMLEIDSVLPMLRMHVLRIGLSKTQLKDRGSTNGSNSQGGNHSQKLTSLFTHRAVEEAHRDVEASKDRLMQEMLFRRARVERRLQREDEEEAERKKQLLLLPPGAKAKNAMRELSGMPSYQSVLADDPPPRRPTASDDAPPRSPGKGDRGPSARSRSPDRSDSPTHGESDRSPSPKPKSKSNARKAESSSRSRDASPSPRDESPKARSKAAASGRKASPKMDGAEKKGGTKAKPKASASADNREEGSRSPHKSPKARSKKAA